MATCLSGAALTLATVASADTTIYRYEDAQGIAVFADRPGTGRQEIALPVVNTYTPSESTQSAATPAETGAGGTYRSVVITGPGDGETIRRNGGNLRVAGRIEPDLRTDHSAILFMDGAARMSVHGRQHRPGFPPQPNGDLQFALAGVDRGPHTLRIAILDQENKTLIESPSVSFHLLRATAGSRQ